MTRDIAVALGIVVLVGSGLFLVIKNSSQNGNNNVACTMEAKMCPDGSYVGRSGPKCEFSACPNTQIETSFASLGQKILNEGVFITPLQVISDSRCPKDVVCIWAGEVSVKVRLEKGGVTKEVTLKESGSFNFEGSQISLMSVTPKENYLFTFKVSPVSVVTGGGTLEGTITTSPTCPVERIPPDPKCAPRPYTTTINIRKVGNQSIVKTVKSDNSGVFKTDISSGLYELEVVTNGSPFPRCNKVVATVKSGEITTANISCDSGIR